jgi:hypothetical protein
MDGLQRIRILSDRCSKRHPINLFETRRCVIQSVDRGDLFISEVALMTLCTVYRFCDNMFPPDKRNPYNLTTGAANIQKTYGGWYLEAPRLWFTNAREDPWIAASVSSDQGPKEPSTHETPIEVIVDGIHCWDLIKRNWVRRFGQCSF